MLYGLIILKNIDDIEKYDIFRFRDSQGRLIDVSNIKKKDLNLIE